MKLSAIIITKNEQVMLPECLKTLDWADEIVVVDSQSQDRTVNIAKNVGAKIISVPSGTDYSTARNLGLAAAKGNWILYIDADERVSPQLKREIISAARNNPGETSYKVPRKNIMLGMWLKHGGFWPDYAHRLFSKDALIKWTGKLHESPTTKGTINKLKNPLTHYTARTISSALTKSAHWAPIEAKLLLGANASRVTWWRVIKVFKSKFFQVYIKRKGFLDGTRGLILAFIQAHHQASILVNLWQFQQQKK